MFFKIIISFIIKWKNSQVLFLIINLTVNIKMVIMGGNIKWQIFNRGIIPNRILVNLMDIMGVLIMSIS